jgi:signal transduction histidine kinase
MSNERILIADDSEEVVDFLQRHLSPQGYEVQTAYDGAMALHLFASQPFDVVLIDMQMLKTGGMQMLRLAKERSSNTQVIILTGHAMLENGLEVVRQGAFDYLLKPVENADLIQLAIGRALEYRKLLIDKQQLLDELQATTTYLAQKIEEQTRELREANALLVRQHQHEVRIRTARLATGLLHQINNAVANIPELVEELESLDCPEPAQAPLQELRLNAVAVTSIGNWLSQFARIGDLSLEPVDIVALAREVLQQLDNQRRRPPHVQNSEVQVAGNIPSIQADRTLIRILIENLLQNAYEAIPPTQTGDVVVSITGEGDTCALRFRDNGIGIRAEDYEAIWKWGWTTKRKAPNVDNRGLGLYASREIVTAHEGTLELESSSSPGGTTFLVRIPITGPRTFSVR